MVGTTLTHFSPTTSFDLNLTKTQIGLGLGKDLHHGWTAGLGVATEYTKWDPDFYAYISKNITF